MITRPTMIGTIFRIALSLFLKTATIPAINPANPKAATTKVGKGKNAMIFIVIKTIKATLKPNAHLPETVFGKMESFIASRIIPCVQEAKLRFTFLSGCFLTG